jgi:hypothetical protein
MTRLRRPAIVVLHPSERKGADPGNGRGGRALAERHGRLCRTYVLGVVAGRPVAVLHHENLREDADIQDAGRRPEGHTGNEEWRIRNARIAGRPVALLHERNGRGYEPVALADRWWRGITCCGFGAADQLRCYGPRSVLHASARGKRKHDSIPRRKDKRGARRQSRPRRLRGIRRFTGWEDAAVQSRYRAAMRIDGADRFR